MAAAVLRAVGGADTEKQIASANALRAQTYLPPASELTGLSGYVTDQWILMRRHRDNTAAGWSYRLLRALRAYNGVYEPEILAEIQKFGGSQVYARIITTKCRGTSSLLRDVYLGPEKPWGIEPPTDPVVPPNIYQAIEQLVRSETQAAIKGHVDGLQAHAAHNFAVQQVSRQALTPGVEPGPSQMPGDTGPQTPDQVAASLPPPPPPIPSLPDAGSIRDRFDQLEEAARQAAKKNAANKAKIAEDKIQQILSQGDFYTAFAEFLVDLPLFPYAVLKGPIVRIKTVVEWQRDPQSLKTTPITVNKPLLCWERISPFDLYWTPGVSDIEDGNIIERKRLTRKELNDLLDLPGYDQDAVRAVLDDYGRGGLVDNWDQTDAERAILESRENPRFNQSGLIACLEFQGYVQGKMLIQAGMDSSMVPDPIRDYFVQAWLIGRYIIKVQMAPSPRKRHQYYVTSFEKVPGTIVGNGLPDILSDITTVANAVLRAMVNNISISSGPQVTINDDRLGDGEDGEDLYPWKRWHVKTDPFGNNTQPAVSFFQPQSNAQELMSVYTAWSALADEMSAIPKVATGSPQAGPIGRTSSGMQMILQGASKILQNVAANVDRDVIEPALSNLLDMILLTDQSGLLSGEEKLRILGVNVAMEKETELQKKLQFLQLTANPIDMQVIGIKGRAVVLKDIADDLNMPGNDIVPTEQELEAQQKEQEAQQQVAAAQAAAAGQPPPEGGPGTPMGPSGGGTHQMARRAQGMQMGSPASGPPRLNLNQQMSAGGGVQGGPGLTGAGGNTPV